MEACDSHTDAEGCLVHLYNTQGDWQSVAIWQAGSGVVWCRVMRLCLGGGGPHWSRDTNVLPKVMPLTAFLQQSLYWTLMNFRKMTAGWSRHTFYMRPGKIPTKLALYLICPSSANLIYVTAPSKLETWRLEYNWYFFVWQSQPALSINQSEQVHLS